MRWEALFADLEAQLERERAIDDDQMIIEGERHRVAELALVDRVRAVPPERDLTLRLIDGRVIRLADRSFGQGWLVGELRPPALAFRTLLIPLSAVAGLILASDERPAAAVTDAETEPRLSRGIGLRIVLRDLGRRRTTVTIVTGAGQIMGTIDRVGSDHLDLAVHEQDVPRRASAVRSVEVIPLAALISVSC